MIRTIWCGNREGDMMQNFDATLGMFREDSKPIDYRRLQFVRWLVEHDRLEHPAAGPPSGPLADALRQVGAPLTEPPPVVSMSSRRPSLVQRPWS
jgi:hypothetical protein